MDKIDAFTDSMASNRADISELKGAFSETTRVQTELREIQNNLIGNFSEAQIFWRFHMILTVYLALSFFGHKLNKMKETANTIANMQNVQKTAR